MGKIQRNRIADDGTTELMDMASSRIQILSAPVQLPGVCGLCGTSRTDDRQYLDIGIWIEMYGQFYFCTICATQFTNTMGGYTQEQAEELDKELNRARQTILDFQEKEAAIDGAINALRSTGLFSGTDLTGIVGTYNTSQQQESQGIVKFSARDEQESTGTISDSKQTDSKQRSDDVPSTGSNELDGWL